jgi:hypothetical protein
MRGSVKRVDLVAFEVHQEVVDKRLLVPKSRSGQSGAGGEAGVC